MKDENKTKEQLINELAKMRKKIADLEEITVEERQAKKKLKESEKKYKDLVEETPIGIINIEIIGKITYINKRLEKISGYSREEIVGKNVFKLGIFPDEMLKILKERLKVRLKGGSTRQRREICFKCKDGKWMWIEITAKLIKKWGIPASFRITVQNINERKQAEQQIKQGYEKLQRTMDTTIYTISKIIETRDPYTAGHQNTVSQLAVAIAQEMKLSEDEIEGIRIAALVHDIGKINIPAEILSKPSKLNEMEFSLIRNHPKIGYDILRKIDFSWPVAQIVLQHHEKIDGSGYPQSLKGEKILLEAKIIGVADVVEAMSSHRPYRPALGIDKALEEISQNRGILYDPEVVDTCLKLFKEKGFKF